MYVDASAMTAILKNEPERSAFIQKIKVTSDCITSAISVFEVSLALSTLTGSCTSAMSEVRRFLQESNVAVVSLDETHLLEAALARDRFGKGTGHPAQLNLGDCISYAVAKTAGVALLYKGNDFAQTDLA
jgi:ribonuclease VapC